MPSTETLTDSRAASSSTAAATLGAPPSFTCTRSDGGSGAAWIHLTGELDLATAPQLEQTLREARVDARLVVLDLRELAFMDCTGLRVIIDADERARRNGSRLIVVRGPARVDRLFTLTGTSDVIEISDHDPRDLPTDRTLPRVHRQRAVPNSATG